MIRLLHRALGVAVGRAGAPGGLRFTQRQLYFELCRVLQPLHAAPRRPRFTLPAPIGYERYLAALRERSEISGLLAGRPATRPAMPAPPDLFDYGLPRLLICQDPSIAGMLLANELHMESACPVYSVPELPLDSRLAGALNRAAEATVYVLHDASAGGFAAVTAVRRWVGEAGLGEVGVRPIGLRPVHAAALHLTVVRGPTAPDLAQDEGLQAWEQRWLRSGATAEVAAVNPARLLRTVHRLVRNQVRVRRQPPRLRRIQAAGFLSWPQ